MLAAVAVPVALASSVWWVFDHRLEFEVVNEGSSPATVEIIAGGYWIERPEAPRIYYGGVVAAGDRDVIVVDKPRDDWTALINGQPVTDSSEWPSDNPQLDLTLRVDADGSVSVLDV